jgi:parallel beta-helix repeat protein
MKKIVLVTIVILVFGAGLLPLALADDFGIAQTAVRHTELQGNKGTTLYVGGSGPGNYSTIQEAIDNATAGDTVFVFNGTYNENIVIGKKISVIGESAETTMIEGKSGVDMVVKILSGEVQLSGFTIKGDTSGQDGIHIFSLITEVIVSYNKVMECSYGLTLQVTSERNLISNNIVSDNEYVGIRLQESDRNEIHENIIERNGEWGISLASLSKQNSISNNTIDENYGGIRIAGGSVQNEIIGNNITNSIKEGIIFEGISTGNTIEANIISDNFGGIKLSGSGEALVTGNAIVNNEMEGILLELSNNNIITANNFIENKRQVKFKLSSRNSWEENYWDNWIGLKLEAPLFKKFPKVIVGFIGINFDMSPMLEPYQI